MRETFLLENRERREEDFATFVSSLVLQLLLNLVPEVLQKVLVDISVPVPAKNGPECEAEWRMCEGVVVQKGDQKGQE